ncbi:MAG: ANTAR domain-containing protein [Streptosporangiales bacterium]|nr:ANTAR domain-containing protein [Streptosporangiales bacterium]
MTPAADQLVRETFVELADTLVAEFDVIDFLDMLAHRSVQLLGVDASGLLLVDLGGRLNAVAASHERARLLELFQLQNSEGPCLDCYGQGAPVSCPDLSGQEGRWPQFAPAALQEGYRAVHALPMRLRSETIGAINLFSEAPGALGAPALELGQALADIATIGILHERAVRRHEVLAEQLQTALNSRVLIEQAKGVLAERLGISVTDGFAVLRQRARRTNTRLGELATAVIDGTADISTWNRGTDMADL